LFLAGFFRRDHFENKNNEERYKIAKKKSIYNTRPDSSENPFSSESE
jgi:hypothetical protein